MLQKHIQLHINPYMCVYVTKYKFYLYLIILIMYCRFYLEGLYECNILLRW